ncbi:MAG: hypothetical protein V3S55_02650, partial [Nitrospiraceae bacterium]
MVVASPSLFKAHSDEIPEQLCNLRPAIFRGQIQGCLSISVSEVYVGPSIQESLNHGNVIEDGSDHQGCRDGGGFLTG